MALVSLLVLNYNGRKFLETVLPSIERQTFRDFEVVLIENGSTDDSEAYVREHWPNVRIVALKPNVGFSRAVNAGFEAATTKYAALICNDNRLDEHWLEHMMKAVEANPAGIFSGRNMDYFHPEVVDDVGGANNLLGYPIALGHLQPMRPEWNEVREVFAFCGNCFVVDCELFLELGGFDGRHFAYLEDSDLGWRARLYGHPSYCVGQAVSFHMLSATLGRESENKRYLIERNRIYMLMKNLSLATLLKLLPLMLGFDLAKTIFFLLTANWLECRVIIRAGWWNVRNLSALRRQRSQIQGRRTITDREVLRWFEPRFSGGSAMGIRHAGLLKILNAILAVYSRAFLGLRPTPSVSVKRS